MNFLSHFYFDRKVTNCYHILGIVLPDLLKNADKNIVLHPEKLHHTNEDINSIIKGWNKHLEVDQYFHSSDFFLKHSHELKKQLTPVIEGSQVKPFFLGHVALELILDNLLITTNKIDAYDFYTHMADCDHDVIMEFLTFAGLKDSTKFFRFFDGFKRDGYLHTYSETAKIAFALKRICMRIWKDPFTDEHEAAINDVVMEYREQIYDSFMQIFNTIDSQLTANLPND